MIYEYGEPRWNDTDGKNEELGEKSVSVPLCPPKKTTWAELVTNLGLCHERPATNCLSYGMA
jgi:hypothetical protein